MQLDSGNSSLSQERFWEEYDKHHDTYIEEYESARAHYIQGMAGHYKKMNNDDIEHHNVIIDIQYD